MADSVKDGKSVSPSYSLSVRFSYKKGYPHSVSEDSLKTLETIAIKTLLTQFPAADPTATAHAAFEEYRATKSMVSPFYAAWREAETDVQTCIAKDYGPSTANNLHIAFDFTKN